MYQILGVKLALTCFGLLCAAVIALWVVLLPPADPSSLKELWKISSGAVTGSALLVTLIGQTPVFPMLCRLPLVRTWFPPIDGQWKAILQSNWPAIRQRTHPGSEPIALAPVPAAVNIIARLFYIRINLASDNHYSRSKTVFVRVSRDPEDGSVALHYLYKNTTDIPASTDSDSHDGAAVLYVDPRNSALSIEGVYWTNRNWHQGLNTAGRITLMRT